MDTIKKLTTLSLLCMLISACAGNYKSSDDSYRPIGQPPITVSNNSK